MKTIMEKWNNISLVKRIIVGLILGIVIALTIPKIGSPLSLLGSLFVGALKAIAPVLVFFLVMAALCQYKEGKKTNMKSIIVLYLLGTLAAGIIGVIGSFLFPVKLVFTSSVENLTPPSGVGEVLHNLLMSIVANPVNALANANYIGILFWAIILGLAFKNASEGSKEIILNISDAMSEVVRWIINLAPFGIMGLVYESISKQGIESLVKYGQLILVLVGCMAFFALVINPIITFIAIRKNPYPLVIKCLRDSGITAFFTRSSAANIPVNMALCKELGLNEDTYSISIPLGSTINMGGAAITISVLALAATHTLGINVDLGTTIILTILSAISACGTSGVAGGSILLVPLACSLFGIPNDVAMQVVGVGFVIGVIQDSCETALNSSTDVLYTAVAEFAKARRSKQKLVSSK